MKTRLLASALASGGRDRGCQRAPQALRPWQPRWIAHEREAQPRPWPEQSAVALSAGASLYRRAALLRRAGVRPLLVGGDHSQAIGYWSGIAAVRGPSMGMIWIDAHLDSHTPASSDSHKLHGMPLATLLGQADERWLSLLGRLPTLDAAHTCVIGYRSYECAEYQLLASLGVHLISAERLHRQSWPCAWQEALQRARGARYGYGVSLDLDVFSPRCAPGVSVPVEGGLDLDAFLPSWRQLRWDTRCKGLEIAEYNPALDRRGQTRQLLRRLIAVHLPLRRR